MSKAALIKSIKSSGIGIIVTLIVIVIYLVSHYFCRKYRKIEEMQKIYNSLAAFLVWAEAVSLQCNRIRFFKIHINYCSYNIFSERYNEQVNL